MNRTATRVAAMAGLLFVSSNALGAQAAASGQARLNAINSAVLALDAALIQVPPASLSATEQDDWDSISDWIETSRIKLDDYAADLDRSMGGRGIRPPRAARPGRIGRGGGGARDGGARTGGARDGGARDGGARDGGARDGGARDGGARDGGARAGGGRDGGARAGGRGARGGGARGGGGMRGGGIGSSPFTSLLEDLERSGNRFQSLSGPNKARYDAAVNALKGLQG